jgi:hypothetical protein
MSWFNVEFSEPKPSLRPGDTLSGEATWTLSETTPAIRLKLVWTTEGKGVDAPPVIVEEQVIDQPATEGKQPFAFKLPDGPWTFEGNLFSVQWYVELGDSEYRYERGKFVLSPTGAPVRVRKDSPEDSEALA